jgi:hypothetical protein
MVASRASPRQKLAKAIAGRRAGFLLDIGDVLIAHIAKWVYYRLESHENPT